jgi:aminoglycoside phosphotransferase family enzyme/predicted kinase
MELARQRVQALLSAAERVGETRLLETHISWVLLAGDQAYKLKKPVNFGFLDFSSLGLREHYCREEVRLNRRLAPDVYLGVVPVTGSQNRPRLGDGEGELLDWAVRMRRFPQSAQLDNQLSAGLLSTRDLQGFAARLAAFHNEAEQATATEGPGLPAAAFKAAMENFEAIQNANLLPTDALADIACLEQWTKEQFRALEPLLEARRRQGKVRECHGDLHLSNLLRLPDGSVTAFDCIEFNPDLRWIDVLNDAAFLVMDLLDRREQALSYGFLNAYLEDSGDHNGLPTLPFFLVYRSMVRAKVALLKGTQDTDRQKRQADICKCLEHIELAIKLSNPARPHLIITHGYSGSGKSWLSSRLAGLIPAIWLRSDVERKRIFKIPKLSDSKSSLAGGMYSVEAGEKTYARLRQLAATALSAGFHVIVDAAFLHPGQRKSFQALGRELGAIFQIVDCQASTELLRARLTDRKRQGGDPSEASLVVLENQLQTYLGLDTEEQALAVAVNTGEEPDIGALAQRLLLS